MAVVHFWAGNIRAYSAELEDALILKAFLTLVVASTLEVGGDALVRIGLRGATYSLAAGALTLFAYGLVVNKSGLDFNRLMGVYIAIFFVVSQIISFVLFRQIPDDRIILGGGFIVAGGLLILLMT
jgi:small multidrug resistance family-3 protein